MSASPEQDEVEQQIGDYFRYKNKEERTKLMFAELRVAVEKLDKENVPLVYEVFSDMLHTGEEQTVSRSHVLSYQDKLTIKQKLFGNTADNIKKIIPMTFQFLYIADAEKTAVMVRDIKKKYENEPALAFLHQLRIPASTES
jgi:hypothetical protein